MVVLGHFCQQTDITTTLVVLSLTLNLGCRDSPPLMQKKFNNNILFSNRSLTDLFIGFLYSLVHKQTRK